MEIRYLVKREWEITSSGDPLSRDSGYSVVARVPKET